MRFKSPWYCIFLSVALSTNVAAEGVYKFRDADGNILFTTVVGEDGLPKGSDFNRYNKLEKIISTGDKKKTLNPVDVQGKEKKKETEAAVAIVNPQNDTPSEEVSKYIKAAEQGDLAAQIHLAEIYRTGEGVVKNDSQAVYWTIKSAEQEKNEKPSSEVAKQDYVHSPFQLSLMEDATKKYAEYLEQAQQGHADAQYQLGISYSQGKGVSIDKAEALGWFLKAAEQGHSDALFKLAKIYELGSDIEQNFVLAQTFYNLSEVAGNKNASTSKEMLRKKMTKDQLLEAKKLSEEWTIGSSLPQITNTDNKSQIKKKAEIAEAKAIAKQEMEERVRRQRDYPYTAEITCRNGNVLFGLMLCFDKTELKITINNRSKVYTSGDFIMRAVENGEVSDNYAIVRVYLPKHFRVTAQNSYSRANFILGVKITNSTGHVVFEDQAGSFGVVSVEH